MSNRPTICLNMIVRNEAHVVHEVLDCVAPYIDYWVIVDTGSDDGTQDVIRSHMAERGIAGELHERPWRNFGANRSEALDLAQGRADYIWVMDADDLLVGDIDLSELTADAYQLHFGTGITYWRHLIFKSGFPWSYQGVVHEYIHCDHQHFTQARLEGDYRIESRRVGGRNKDPEKYARDRDLLLAELERNPDDHRSVYYVAQSCLDYGDFESALKWYRRRAEMGGWDEEVYYSLYKIGDCLRILEEPWPIVLDAYLKAWGYRPTRAEALYEIAQHYLFKQEWHLAYLFGKRVAEIARPEDILFVHSYIYDYAALDNQSVSASWLGRHEEAFSICRRLIASEKVDEQNRARIAANRDFSVPHLMKTAERYPESAVDSVAPHSGNAVVTVSIAAGPEREVVERTVNSFLNCCTDRSRVGRFILIDNGVSDPDRAALLTRYPFLEFVSSTDGELTGIRSAVDSRYWLHLPYGWQFFFAEDLIRRLTSVLEAEPDISHVGINLDDATQTSGSFAARDSMRSTGDGSGYVLTDKVTTGPAMYDTTRFLSDDMTRSSAATLDEVLVLKQA